MRPGYKQTEVGEIPEEWDAKPLSRVAPLQRGFDLPTPEVRSGPFPVVYSNGVLNYHNKAMVPGPGVVTGRSGTIGKVNYIENDYWPHNTTLWVTSFKGNDTRFIYYLYQDMGLERFGTGSGVPTLNRNDVHSCVVPLPPLPEQRAIAGTLSDVDALIGALDQLIAKKRDLKQAAMQQLLTGKKRLTGFRGEWEVKALGVVASVSKGSQLHSSESSPDGKYAHLNGGISPSGYTEKFNAPANTVAISEGGNSCGYVQFRIEPYWCGGHCYSVIPTGIENSFLYHALKGQQAAIMRLRVGSGLPNVQKTALLAFNLHFPRTEAEQTAISEVLSDMDDELTALERRCDKTRALKQGMMQELLTGRTRLV